MRLAVWYPESTWAAWSATLGVVDELRRMGHDITAVPAGKTLPTISDFNWDAILLLGLEHYWKMLDAAYSKAVWRKIAISKIAWYHESAIREDYNPITAEVLEYADEHFFPAAQDAEFFDQEHFVGGRSHWLPFGVDTEIFSPAKHDSLPGVWDPIMELNLRKIHKVYNCAFIGLLYPKRESFLQRLSRHLANVDLLCGNVEIRDLSGPLLRDQTQLYAENIRQIKVFVNLPALSQHLVTKVFEVMACGTLLITPGLEGAAARNMVLFKHKQHLLYYPENHLGYLAQLMREYNTEDGAKERERIAAAGYAEVYAKHSLRIRLEAMFATLGIESAKEAHA